MVCVSNFTIDEVNFSLEHFERKAFAIGETKGLLNWKIESESQLKPLFLVKVQSGMTKQLVEAIKLLLSGAALRQQQILAHCLVFHSFRNMNEIIWLQSSRCGGENRKLFFALSLFGLLFSHAAHAVYFQWGKRNTKSLCRFCVGV